MARRRPVGRHLVLDNQAASALLRGPRAERRLVLEALAAADGGSIVLSAVRVEAGWDRRTGAAAPANRLVPSDAALGGHASVSLGISGIATPGDYPPGLKEMLLVGDDARGDESDIHTGGHGN